MRCRLSFVLIYVSLLLLVGCGTNFSLSHKTTPSFLTPHTQQTPYTIAPYTEFALPQLSEKDCASGPQGITVGPDGALWFTDNADKIGRITTQGRVTEFALPTFVSYPEKFPAQIIAGPDGALWFTETGDQIGRITLQGKVTEFALSSPQAGYEMGITVGSDGALWFTEPERNKIGRITTRGQITEFALLSSPDSPSNGGGITTGPDGALWFTQGWGPLGRITTQGHITLFSPHYSGGPGRIVAGPDGALWMTEVDPHAGLIGRFSTSSARVPESRKVSATTFPCPVVTPIPTAPSTPSPSGS
jgi:streptogramin lyase